MGLGVISRVYLETLSTCADVRVVAVADLDDERARAVAETLPHARALRPDDLPSHDGVDTVLNLTTPAAHAPVALAAIRAERNVYGEKPLATTMTDAHLIEDSARAAGVWFGAAPDTVLGTGLQTARHALATGAIGRPTSAIGVWLSSGHEVWHPSPEFYYRADGGPLLDMGPYYIAALVQLLGPVIAVTAMSSRARDERRIGTGPRAGALFEVDVDTHLSGSLRHEGGAVSTLVTGFDGGTSSAPSIEVHGEAGSLVVPDPNTFDGTVRLRAAGSSRWTDLAPAAGFEDGRRGVGLLDAIRRPEGPGRASGRAALHALDVMTALLDSARTGATRSVASRPGSAPLVPLTSPAQWRGATLARDVPAARRAGPADGGPGAD